MAEIRATLGKARQQYNRGSSWTQSPITALGIIVLLINQFQTVIIGLGFPSSYMWLLYGMAIPFYVLGNYIIGVIDLNVGIWRQENDCAWLFTPMAMELVKNVKSIKTAVCDEKD